MPLDQPADGGAGVDFPTLISLAPQLGAAGLILLVFVVVSRYFLTDRGRLQDELDKAMARSDKEMARMAAAHDAEIAELRAEIKELRAALAGVNAALDVERAARRAAEDTSAKAARRAEGRP